MLDHSLLGYLLQVFGRRHLYRFRNSDVKFCRAFPSHLSNIQWKNTIGPVENRPLNENRWEYTFTHRFYPDYFQSYGFGFFEFFQLAEDIGAEPLPL